MAVDSMAKASTPELVGPHALWHKLGFRLPSYIEHISNDLIQQRGMDESHAVAAAIAIVKRWAAGIPTGGMKRVHADTQAAAGKAVAEWEATKARAKTVKSVKGLSNPITVSGVSDTSPRTDNTLLKGRRKRGRMAAMKNAGTVKGKESTTSPGARKSAASSGKAMPDGSFPTQTRARYDDAVRAVGRANPSKRARLLAYLRRRAKAEGWPPPGASKSKNMSNVDLAANRPAAPPTKSKEPETRQPTFQRLTAHAHAHVRHLGPQEIARLHEHMHSAAMAADHDADDDAALLSNLASGIDLATSAPTYAAGGMGAFHAFKPVGRERTSFVSRLKTERALRSSGRTRQADHLHASLLKEATSRARRMPDGSRRAHTRKEAAVGLALMRGQNAMNSTQSGDAIKNALQSTQAPRVPAGSGPAAIGKALYGNVKVTPGRD